MKEMNILYLTDNNYAIFTGVSILSLFENNKHVDLFNVYIIDDSISEENKGKISAIAKRYKHNIIFLDLTEGIRVLQEMKIPKYRNSYTTYLKLFAFGLLPDSVKRIFFIDGDSIIVDDLSEMIDIDMHGKMIGAVRDGLAQSYKESLGYGYYDPWFNMGVMLVDVTSWKQNMAEKKIINQLKKRKGYIAVDQDLLNITQHGNIMTLHPRYNFTPHHYVFNEVSFRRAFPQGGFYTLKTIENAKKRPAIFHFERFIGMQPWHIDSVHPYTPLFDVYLAKSPWQNYKKQKVKLSPANWVESILYKLLPKELFVYIYGIGFRFYLSKMNKKLLSTVITNIS